MAYNVLVIEDTPDWRKKLVGYLIEEGEYDIKEADNYESASKIIQEQPLDVAIVDIRLVDWDEEDNQGMQLLRELDEIADVNGTQAIVITGYGTKDRMRKAFRNHQVVDFIEKQHFDPDEFKATLLKAAEKARRRRMEIIDRKYPE
jgi:DNA-binding NtrC family response regulator